MPGSYEIIDHPRRKTLGHLNRPPFRHGSCPTRSREGERHKRGGPGEIGPASGWRRCLSNGVLWGYRRGSSPDDNPGKGLPANLGRIDRLSRPINPYLIVSRPTKPMTLGKDPHPALVDHQGLPDNNIISLIHDDRVPLGPPASRGPRGMLNDHTTRQGLPDR